MDKKVSSSSPSLLIVLIIAVVMIGAIDSRADDDSKGLGSKGQKGHERLSATLSSYRGAVGRIVERAGQSEHYFSQNDTQSDAVMILTVYPTSGATVPFSTESYVLWDWSGAITIPDGPDGSWTGLDCLEPSGIPTNAEVTKVKVHHEIAHPYIGDLEVKVYNSSHTWMVRDNEGGSANDINETRTEESLFDGDNPTQNWYYRVRDTFQYDTGTLNVMQLYVYYDYGDDTANLTPYKPSGWSDKIVVSDHAGTNSDDSPLYITDTLYIDWAGTNNGSAATSETFYSQLYIDDVLEQTWYTSAPLNPGSWFYAADYSIGSLAEGAHEIKIVLDYDNIINESDEYDNEYIKPIEIFPSGEPDIRISPLVLQVDCTEQTGGVEQPVCYEYQAEEPVRIIIDGRPPEFYRATVVETPQRNLAAGINVLDEVPAFDWCFGCSATSAAMMMGYYDRHGYPDMYTGTANGGVCPLSNCTSETCDTIGCNGHCSLSATELGLDGRSVRGNVDDYWIGYGNCDDDPWITNGWEEHLYEDCTGDFMGTNQSSFNNCDGATSFWFYQGGAPLCSYEPGPGYRDGGFGLALFVESRGYTVLQCCNQYIQGQGTDPNLGFTFEDFKNEIDAGRPVLVQVTNHTMLGYGYNTSGETIYIHDTWDCQDHTMVWGGTYSGLQHWGVTYLHIEQVQSQQSFTIYNDGGGSLEVTSITKPSWVSLQQNPPYSIGPGDSKQVYVEIDCNACDGLNLSERLYVYSNDSDENPYPDGVYIDVNCPRCFPSEHPDYNEWVAVGEPNCWCYPRQCHGDADGQKQGLDNYWVSTHDLAVLRNAWNKPLENLAEANWICADFDHAAQGKGNYRVSTHDLAILRSNWQIPNKPDANCLTDY